MKTHEPNLLRQAFLRTCGCKGGQQSIDPRWSSARRQGPHREAGIALKRQAVLFRAAHHSDLLEIELWRRDIPFVEYGGLKFLEAAHVKGTWPGGGHAQLRLVLVGDASFAANAFFPYASNGDLAVSMIRWLAEDTAAPLLKPETYSLPEMRLTHRQIQVTFLLVEALLPLSVMVFGAAVWWRRR